MIHKHYLPTRKVAHPHCAKHKIKQSIYKRTQNEHQRKAIYQIADMFKTFSLTVLPSHKNDKPSINTHQNRTDTIQKSKNIEDGGDITGHKLFDSVFESSSRLKPKLIHPDLLASSSENAMDIDVINSPTSITEKKSVSSLIIPTQYSDEPSAEFKHHLKYQIKTFDELYPPESVQFPPTNSTKILKLHHHPPKTTPQNRDIDHKQPILKKSFKSLFNVCKATKSLDALLKENPQLTFIVKDLKRKLLSPLRIEAELKAMKVAFPNVHYDISYIQKKYINNQSIDTDLHRLILKNPDLKPTVGPIMTKLKAENMHNLDQFKIVYSALKKLDIIDVLTIIFDALYELPFQKEEKYDQSFNRDRYFSKYNNNQPDFLTLFKDHFSNDLVQDNYPSTSFEVSSQTTVNHRQTVNNLLFTIDIFRLHKISIVDCLTIATESSKKHYFSEEKFLLDLFADLKSQHYQQFKEKIVMFNQFVFQDEKTA